MGRLGAAVRIRPDAAGRGLSLAVVPSWGAAGRRAGGARSLDAAGRPAAALDGGDPGMRLGGELGWGFGVPGARAVLTPYAGLSLGEAHARALRQGWRLRLGPGAVFGLEAARRWDQDDARDDRLLLHGSLRW